MRTERSGAVVLALAAHLPLAASAQDASGVAGNSVAVSQSITSEDNLYRLADGVSPPPGGARSDRVATTTLTLAARLPLSRQTLSADARIGRSHFAENPALDHVAHRVALGLDWATVGRLSGSAAVWRERSLVRFDSDAALAGVAALERNLATVDHADALLRIGWVTRWSGELRATADQADYSSAAYRSRAFRQTGASVGVRHASSDALGLGAALRFTEGRYPHFAQAADGSEVADRYRGRYVDLLARWVPGAASRVDARLSAGRTSFERATASDVSGLTGLALWTWQPSAKVRVQTQLARDRGQDAASLFFPGSGRFADFSRTTTSLSLGLQYAASEKVQLTAGLGWAQRSLVDTRQDLAGAETVRHGDDRTRVATLGVRWLPWRAVTLGCDVAREQRSHGGDLSTDYHAGSRSCFAQFQLG